MIFGLFTLCLLPYTLAELAYKGEEGVWKTWGLRSSSVLTSTERTMASLWTIVNAFLANSPRLMLSFVYLSINRLCTGICCAIEWNDSALRRKGLRTSYPQGSQRSTHYLQLPWKWAIPLISTFGILHWLLSQSLFLVRIDLPNPDPSDPNPFSISACGFSFLSLLCWWLFICFPVNWPSRFLHPTRVVRSSALRAIPQGTT
jgi:hypothetical protein